MTHLEIDVHGGRVEGAAGLEVTVRQRHQETWLQGPEPLDRALDAADAEHFGDLVRALADRAEAGGAASVHWESDLPAATVAVVAERADLPLRRDILRMERSLPLPDGLVGDVPRLALRALRPGTADEPAWVRTNNRAFAQHPDQGRESVAGLHRAMAEPWFDAAGFLLLDGDPPVDAGGRLDGFCWTKVHPDGTPDAGTGEIYVIGVDPEAGGGGRGRALVAAGLTHLAGRGVTHVLLYVESDNDPARRLYDRLGFATTRTRRVRSRVR